MGLYDYVKSSYDLGEGFTNVELQTKSLQEYGGFFDTYWIDPAGHLYVVDYFGTQDVITSEDDGREIWPFEYVPNGNHGSVSPVYWTGRLDLTGDGGDLEVLLYEGTIIDPNSNKYRTCSVCGEPIYIPDKYRRATSAVHPHCIPWITKNDSNESVKSALP